MVEAPIEEEFHGRLNVRLWAKMYRKALLYKRYLIPLMIVSIITAVGDVFFNLIVKDVVNNAVAGHSAGIMINAIEWFVLISILGSCIWLFIWLAGKTSSNVSHDIRRDAFAKLQDLSFSYYDHRPVGWLMARVTSDCQRLSSLMAWGTLDIIWSIAMIIAIAVVMIMLNWRLTLIVFTVMPVLVIVGSYFQKIILASSRVVRKINSQITGTYNESIMAVRTTKSMVREEQNFGEFQQLSGQMFTFSVKNAIQQTLYWPMVSMVSGVGTGLALWYGGQQYIATLAGTATQPMDLGTLIAFMGLTGMFFSPIHEVARVLSDVYATQASAERVLGLLETVPEIQDAPQVKNAVKAASQLPPRKGVAPDGLPARLGSVEFRNVSFAYKEGQPVLEDFNLKVESGQTIALVGPTGGGKSTIVSLLCRFYEPTAGEILFDGIDYRKRSLQWLQSQLGIVLQTPHLFSGTVKENLRYGRLTASDQELVQAARMVNAHEFISKMEKGYDSDIGQGGNKLSAGQKQLLSLARALLADPQIFVIDEATSSIDTETEKLIQQSIHRVLRGRISFVIAHRLSTIRSADRIIVIDHGRIIEQGTHHELIQLGGRYFELYTNQFTREKEAELLNTAEPEGN